MWEYGGFRLTYFVVKYWPILKKLGCRNLSWIASQSQVRRFPPPPPPPPHKKTYQVSLTARWYSFRLLRDGGWDGGWDGGEGPGRMKVERDVFSSWTKDSTPPVSWTMAPPISLLSHYLFITPIGSLGQVILPIICCIASHIHLTKSW